MVTKEEQALSAIERMGWTPEERYESLIKFAESRIADHLVLTHFWDVCLVIPVEEREAMIKAVKASRLSLGIWMKGGSDLAMIGKDWAVGEGWYFVGKTDGLSVREMKRRGKSWE